MLKVNEIFGPTIQGEGPTQGKVVMFLRLALCNLRCTWCDSKYTWDWSQYAVEGEVHPMRYVDIALKLNASNAVVITGGEPLIQQRELAPLLAMLHRVPGCWIEIETNGTIVPDPVVLALVSQINCSPKLSNSGDTKEARIKPNAINAIAAFPRSFFKFVIGTEQDIHEVVDIVNQFSIRHESVYLMPMGRTKEELLTTGERTRQLADRYGFVYSSRLHIEMYGTRRGV